MIAFQDISKSFDGGHSFAVHTLSLEVPDGETLVLLGSSGSGKTTLLKMVNGLVQPTSGTVSVDGEETAHTDPVALRRSLGYVFQGIGLFPHLTVEQNVGIVPRLLGFQANEQRRRAQEMLELVGLEPSVYGERFPEELSGGQQQRVGVARALAAEPAHLLMDEPFGALDAVTRDELQQELLSLKKRLHKTILFVTHDVFEAIRLGDRIAVLHEGRLEQVGAPREVLRQPATPYVEQLVGRIQEQLHVIAELLT
ncbi:MAG: ABC transporter ATP-binding protein [Acidimicrobiia bacterium]